MNTQHIELKLSLIRRLFEELSTRIDALEPGERLPLTNYANSIARKYGLSGNQLLPIILMLTRDYPGTITKYGPKGGVVKIDYLVEGDTTDEEG